MKKTILILFVLFVSQIGFSQADSVLGKWKVVAVNNGEAYYNVKTDSVSVISEELKETYSDASKIGFLKDLMKSMYMDNRFEFSDKGVFKMESELVGNIESKFKIDNKRKVIITEGINGPDDMARVKCHTNFLKVNCI